MFLPNLQAALDKIRDMLLTNGRLCTAVWSVPSEVPLPDLAFTTVRKQIDTPAAPPSATPGPLALAYAHALKQSFIQAGFKDIKIDILQITFDFDSHESYARFYQQIAAPIHAMLANHTEEVKKLALDSITQVVWQYPDSHSKVNLDNKVICML